MKETKVLCREEFQRKLVDYLPEDEKEEMPPSLFIYGNTATGKTLVLREFLKPRSCLKTVFVNCIECSTARSLFEVILLGFKGEMDDTKADTTHNFILEMNQLRDDYAYVIVLDNVERLRDVDTNVFMTLLRLQEFTHLNITVILVSQIILEKYYPRETGEEMLQIFVPNYTKDDIAMILTENFRLGHIDGDVELFEQFLTLFLNVFYKACRDLIELRFMAYKYFKIYCEPIEDGTIERTDARKLWLNIAKPLKVGLGQLYMRFSESRGDDLKLLPKLFELPLYDKYLLIAGFLASHNAPKDDLRLFVKHHGKQKKRAQQAHNVKVSEKTKLQLGPKSFTDERLWAIFSSIVGKQVDRSMVMEARALTLINLRLFRIVSGENVWEGTRRMACNVGLDFITSLSQSIEFDIRPYLQFFTK